MRAPNLWFVVLLCSMNMLQAVRDNRIDAVVGQRRAGPDEKTFTQLFAQGANPCGGQFLNKLREPHGNKVVSYAWQKINEPIDKYLEDKKAEISDLEAAIELTMTQLDRANKKKAVRDPFSGSISDMIGAVCTPEFAIGEVQGKGTAACVEVKCGLEFWEIMDMYNLEDFVAKFEEMHKKDLGTYNFVDVFGDQCKKAIPDDRTAEEAEDEMSYGLETSWCDELCNKLSDTVNKYADDSGSGSASKLAVEIEALNTQLLNQNTLLGAGKQELEQCTEAKASVAKFVDSMTTLGEDYSDRAKDRQKVQWQQRRAERILQKYERDVKVKEGKEEKAKDALDEANAAEKEVQDAVEKQTALEKNWIEKVQEQDRRTEAAKADLDDLNDAQDKVAEFKSKLSLILLKISLLYDSVLTNPLRKLLIDESSLREHFVDPTKVKSGSSEQPLIAEVENALLELKGSCAHGVLVGLKPIVFRDGRLLLPSEAANINTSSPTLQKLMDGMPTGIGAITFPAGFLSPGSKPGGLVDMCESPEIAAVKTTVEQVLDVVKKRREHLIEAFTKILSVATPDVVEITYEHHTHGDGHNHQPGGDLDNEEQYECDHEPRGTRKFAAVFGEINFYKNFVKMWAHMDSGSGLSYFMRLEAQLYYLFLVAQSRETDHVMDLAKFQKMLEEVTQGKKELLQKLEEAAENAAISKQGHDAIVVLLNDAKEKYAKQDQVNKDLIDALKQANVQVGNALNAAKDKHQSALDGVGGNSLLATAMRAVHNARLTDADNKNKKSSQNKSVVTDAENPVYGPGLYGSDATAWRKEALQLETELEKLQKGAVFLSFLK